MLDVKLFSKKNPNTNVIIIKSKAVVAPNIALIKYWGKFDEKLIIPLNSSISLTLDTQDLNSTTEIKFSNKYKQDQFILNGQDQMITQRIMNTTELKVENQLLNHECLSKMHFKIKSINNFPTASGLASSASGLACLTFCLSNIFQFQEKYKGQLTEIARMGSGSACRSLYGGIVQWFCPEQQIIEEYFMHQNIKFNKELLSQSCIAQQIFNKDNSSIVKDCKIMILIQNFQEKELKSSQGMEQSVTTSSLIKYRVQYIVPERIKLLIKAIEQNNWNKFCEITIADSNQFHSICLDSTPPIFYLNDFSRYIINFIEDFNCIQKQNNSFIVGYTFDAGPHAVLLIHENNFQLFHSILAQIIQNKEIINFSNNEIFNNEKYQQLINKYKGKILPTHIIQTKIGEGPKIL